MEVFATRVKTTPEGANARTRNGDWPREERLGGAEFTVQRARGFGGRGTKYAKMTWKNRGGEGEGEAKRRGKPSVIWLLCYRPDRSMP